MAEEKSTVRPGARLTLSELESLIRRALQVYHSVGYDKEMRFAYLEFEVAVRKLAIIEQDIEIWWRMQGRKPETHCHDCGVAPGQIHKFGCDMESCPFCEGQLIICGCCYEKLSIDCSEGSYVYQHGLTAEQEGEWLNMLEEKGRIPCRR